MSSKVALCISPLLHGNLQLADRAEVGLAGFIVCDLWFMLQQTRCSAMGLPKGSCGMAPQTVYNLQGCALIGIVMTLTLQEQWSPWHRGQCRLSELAIEEWFSLLRRQSSNSQLSTRAFWQAGTRQSFKHGSLLNREKAEKRKDEKPLTEQELLGHLYHKCFNHLQYIYYLLSFDHGGVWWSYFDSVDSASSFCSESKSPWTCNWWSRIAFCSTYRVTCNFVAFIWRTGFCMQVSAMLWQSFWCSAEAGFFCFWHQAGKVGGKIPEDVQREWPPFDWWRWGGRRWDGQLLGPRARNQ